MGESSTRKDCIVHQKATVPTNRHWINHFANNFNDLDCLHSFIRLVATEKVQQTAKAAKSQSYLEPKPAAGALKPLVCLYDGDPSLYRRTPKTHA